MSDLWPSSSSPPPPPPPIIHHSPLSQSSPFISSPPPLSSPSSPRSHGNPHAKVTSPHLCQLQVTSPHLQPQVTSPHLPHVTSAHFRLSQVNSPHLLSPPQHHLYNQNHDPGLDNPNWSRSEPASELSYLLKSYSYSYQNQTTAHLDPHLQNQFSNDVTDHRDELENTYRLPCNTHTLLDSGVYEQGDRPGPVQNTWRPLGPTLSQLQGSPLGSMSGEVALGRWSSVEFSSSSAEDYSSTQFFHDSCHDNNAPQPFCSPTTPGPSPHYPQTPTISSPGPQMHPREERPDFHAQASRQLNRNKTLSCCLHESDGYPMISDPGQHHPHQTSRHLLQSQSELNQDQTGLLDAAGISESRFSPQGRGRDVSGAAQPPGLLAGLSWREECGGGRRRGRGGVRRGGDSEPNWTWIKRPQPENSTETLDSRLLCTVCNRDFRSLPALNGHMRSHSGSRSAAWLKKGERSSPPVSMVMPVSVPVQSRGTTKACKGGQRRSSRLSPATGGAALYRSLLRQEEEEGVARGDGAASGGRDDEEAVVVGGDSGVHYTPPPMLCPLRAGPGLYCSLATGRQQRVQTVQLHATHNGLGDLVAVETASPPPGTLTTGINEPRINVGRGFQADIPPLRGRKYAHSDSHNALLLWAPWDELGRPINQQRVEALLAMARCSVVPGGGASPESALRVLLECRGDFLLTVEKLLSSPETSTSSRAAQPHPGVSWSAEERRLLVKSLQLHHKDFSRIQKAVRTKSLSQCVEFYYLWKKQLSLSTRTPAGLTVTLPDTNGQRSSRSHAAS
ncbi:mitotic deacetylase-associated SANT domain protein-like [Siniperca chuatsi]|uniref:mitotic deacetylase-associated SANT domain protein-like n=1 Tax=Siniperca chuatsi TaxID=119488 RepID=UPI001CE120AC|nr:mitotic deacetylase-associated SANT domain protein-like [Siniperca chuatsi]